jgi:DNA-binding transcriptional MerR regulator
MSEENEVSPVETQALELGWQPKEDFEADPKNEGKKWRSAEEFMDRKPLFDKIEAQGRELKEVKRALQHLGQQSTKIEELAYKKALDDLKSQKRQALEEADHDRVIEIDETIQELKDRKPPPPQQNQPNPEFVKWVEENKWYATDAEMRAVADGIGMSLARAGGLGPDEIMQKVTDKMKELFPAKFGRTSRVPPNPDSGGSRKSNGTGAAGVESMMSPMERRIMDTIINTGMSKDDYIKQFVATQPERFKGVKL